MTNPKYSVTISYKMPLGGINYAMAETSVTVSGDDYKETVKEARTKAIEGTIESVRQMRDELGV